MKISDLEDGNKRVNIVVKVGEIGGIREVKSKFKDETYRLADVTVMDESGSMKMTLWNDQIGQVKVGDTLELKNAYVTSFKGETQLNVGKFGSMTKALVKA